MQPDMAYTIEAEHGESAWTYLVYSRDTLSEMGIYFPPIKRKWDSQWGMHFLDWDALSEAETEMLQQASDDLLRETGLYAFSNGPGRSFGSAPCVSVHRKAVVVSQFTGLDI